MHKAVFILALVALLAGCGGGDKPDPAPTATATATVAEADPLAGYSDGVRDYYAGANPAAVDDPNADAEVRYFQPPRPGEAKLGEQIILTGANIGVETAVTVTKVDTVKVDGKDYVAVELELDNGVGGITVLDTDLKTRHGQLPRRRAGPRGRARREGPVLELVRCERAPRRRREAEGVPALPRRSAAGALPDVARDRSGRRRRDLEPQRSLTRTLSITTGASGASVRGSVMIAPIFCTTGSPSLTLPSRA